VINPLDQAELRRQVRSAVPFPFCAIDNFLSADFADRVYDAFPAYADARKMGRVFRTVNEKEKVQITDPAMFAAPIAELNRVLAAPDFLELLSSIFGIPHLLADPGLIGGGIHQTGPSGRLDVHVDFNFEAERRMHRRLNILLYFNKDWKTAWGGNLELWDKDIRTCHHSLAPNFNRCVIFETSEISYHGVAAVNCPAGHARKSFAAYYYTHEPPPGWTGAVHGTVFRSRPDEAIKGNLLMPAERAGRRIREAMYTVTRGVKRIVKGA
jgi:hypothetical protein